jgi:SAM-dependent methyltransferase
MPTGTIPYVATAPVRLWKAIGQTAGVPFRGAGPLSVAGFAEALVGRGAPDEWLSVTRYRQLAAGYDLWTQTGQGYRHDTVRRLQLAPGGTVLDIGCGTGLNFVDLEQRVGPAGRVVGIDLSSDMLARAQLRIDRHGWTNVTLIQAAVEDASIPGEADGALLCGVHDVLRSPSALSKVISHVRPGAHVVAGGAKWAPWWRAGSLPLNLLVWLLNRDYVTTFEGFARPWSHLAPLLQEFEVQDVFGGGGFIATGTRGAKGSLAWPCWD